MAINMPTTVSTAQTIRKRRAWVRSVRLAGLLEALLDNEKAVHVTKGRHRVPVSVDAAGSARHEALPAEDACASGLEREGDLVVRAGGRSAVELLQRHEHAEVGDREAVSESAGVD